MKTFFIEEPVFGSVLNCYVDCTYDEMVEHVGRDEKITLTDEQKKDECHQGVYIWIGNKKTSCRIIWIEKKDNLPTIAHECVHAAQHLLNERGIEVDWDNKEVIAYLTEFYFKEFLEKMKEPIKKCKKKK